MSLTQTYYVASTARSKLGREAARADHNLRRLVGHANMLDQLMVELSHAEAEQEAWFNQTVHAAGKAEEPRRVQWIDTIAEETEPEEEEQEDDVYDEDEDEEEDSDYEDFESQMFNVPLRRLKSPPVSLMAPQYDDEDDSSSDEEEDEDEDEEMEQSASPSSFTSTSPPELTYDEDASDSDEEMPSSPRNAWLELSEKERQAIASYTAVSTGESEDLVLQRQQQRQPLIAAC